MIPVRKIGKILALFFALFFSFTSISYADGECPASPTAPSLYQIDRSGSQATLFFTPVNDDIQSYTIIYGLSSGDERYSTTFNSGASTGAISHTISDLTPGVKYYFKVEANTSCTSSPWSEWVADNNTASGSATLKKSASRVPVTGSETTMTMTVFSLLMILGGFGMFSFATRKNY